jgi:pimeloyl-ACP methyl ester carboxylesterase
MSTYALIHGAGDGGWSWHLVEAELRARGHDVVAPDLPANDDALNGVPRELAAVAISKARAHPSAAAMAAPWPLDRLPDVPIRFVLCTEDRFFPAAFVRRVVAERLAVAPDELAAGHCAALSRPVELADLLEQTGRRQRPRLRLIDHYVGLDRLSAAREVHLRA